MEPIGQVAKYTCPCCGFKTLHTQERGSYDICPVCYWEDDLIQYQNPDYDGGANKVSLRIAQRNYMEFNASEPDWMKFVSKPGLNESKDPKWSLLSPKE